ncbi:MAG TPA: DUF6438 domain-containing protein [Chloroflexia bacterium]|jgi:hypothetical protein
MRPYLSTLISLFLLVLASAGCNTSLGGGNAAEEKLCHRTPASEGSKVTSNYADNAEPTPTALPTQPTTGSAPPYDQIYAGLKPFNLKFKEMFDKPYSDISQRDTVKEEALKYLRRELYKKRVTGWQGWVVQTGMAALEYGHGGIDPDEDYSNLVLLSMRDPYSRPPDNKGDYGYFRQLAEPLVLLLDTRDISGQEMCIGQKVVFSGDASWSPTLRFFQPTIYLTGATTDVLEDALSERAVAPHLRDVVMRVERTEGFMGLKSFVLTMFGDGTVVFEGLFLSKIDGFLINTMEKTAVRQLLAEFDKAGFFSMPDSYDGGGDFHQWDISVTTGNETKYVHHHGGHRPPPEELLALEEKILELTNTAEWLGW